LPTDAPTAFFSYSREDSEFALKLAEDLKAAGAVVWIDQLDIEPGQEWDNAIEDAVTQCPRMLLILTAASVQSKKVRNEIAFALDEQKTIIPVLCQDCMVPLQLRRIQHIDFRTDYARGLKALLKTLGVEQPAAASAAAATAAPVESQPVVSDAERWDTAEQKQPEEEHKPAAEKSRLEQEREAAQARREEESKRAAERLQREKEERAEHAREYVPTYAPAQSDFRSLSPLLFLYYRLPGGRESPCQYPDF
jgi:DNA polymerase III gamma/tau subunit